MTETENAAAQEGRRLWAEIMWLQREDRNGVWLRPYS